MLTPLIAKLRERHVDADIAVAMRRSVAPLYSGRPYGVRALDDRTVEFRLAAPAPYFMSVMNRPDSGPQPRHAIETAGDRWTEAGAQVVSGPFRQVVRTPETLTLERNPGYAGTRPGIIARLADHRPRPGRALRPRAVHGASS